MAKARKTRDVAEWNNLYFIRNYNACGFNDVIVAVHDGRCMVLWLTKMMMNRAIRYDFNGEPDGALEFLRHIDRDTEGGNDFDGNDCYLHVIAKDYDIWENWAGRFESNKDCFMNANGKVLAAIHADWIH